MGLTAAFSVIVMVILFGAVLAVVVGGRGLGSDLARRVPRPIPCSECAGSDDSNCISFCGMRF
jgi:hypothetical protein